MKTLTLAAALLCLASAGFAAPKAASPVPPPSEGAQTPDDDPEQVLRVVVEAEYEGMRHAADFLVVNANQSNFVQGGETAFSVDGPGGRGLEFKKWGFIANVLPVVDPNRTGRVNLQLQLELSGPVEGKHGVEVRTWQLQTTLYTLKGKPKAVARGKGRAVVTVTRVPDEE